MQMISNDDVSAWSCKRHFPSDPSFYQSFAAREYVAYDAASTYLEPHPLKSVGKLLKTKKMQCRKAGIIMIRKARISNSWWVEKIRVQKLQSFQNEEYVLYYRRKGGAAAYRAIGKYGWIWMWCFTRRTCNARVRGAPSRVSRVLS